MAIDNGWNEAAKRLAILTERGTLNWMNAVWPASIRENEGVVGDVLYGAVLKNKWVMVYEYRYRAYMNEEEFEWTNDVAIEFVDAQGNLEWRWPTVPYRVRLLDTIRCKVSGAQAFLRELLEDDIPEDDS